TAWSTGSSPTRSWSSSRTRRRRSRPTETSSTIRRRPRSSAGGRASGCWTSTRTRTVRGRCSTSSGSQGPFVRDAGALRRIAIVPAYNEEGCIGLVLDEIRAFDDGLDIVVVDDGSVDRTAQIATAAGARVLRLPFNLGIGGAV